jgi:hypothetical protein
MTHFRVMILAKVVNGVDSILLQIRETFEKLGDIVRRNFLERGLGYPREFNKLLERFPFLRKT